MIKSYVTTILTNLEVFSVYKDCLINAKANDPITLNIEAEVALFEEKLNAYDVVLRQTNKSTITNQLALLDDDRDNLVRGIELIVEAYIKFPELERRQAALAVDVILNKYQNKIERLPYLEESAAIHDLINQLNSEPQTPHVTLLGLTDWVVKLETANDKFTELYNQRNNEGSTYVKGSTKQSRKETQDAFANLCEMINAHARLSGEAPYKLLIDEINKIISNAKLKHKQSQPHTDANENKKNNSQPHHS